MTGLNVGLIGQMTLLNSHVPVLVPVAFGFLAVWLLMPRARPWPRVWGWSFGLVALATAGVLLLHPAARPLPGALFGLFAAAALLAAVCMITSRNPLYAALWFAVTTLSVCGLFLLRSAPFLAAATVIVYAGAIVVTFLFLIMLAQQAVGSATYDQQSRQPLLATMLGFVVLGGLLCILRPWPSAGAAGVDFAAVDANRVAAAQGATAADAAGSPRLSGAEILRPAVVGAGANPLSLPGDESLGSVRGLGRTLFGTYLYAVELAGTLLLTAAIGAIAIGMRVGQRKR